MPARPRTNSDGSLPSFSDPWPVWDHETCPGIAVLLLTIYCGSGHKESGQDNCAGVVCNALDACHISGICDPQSGVCSNPIASNGTTCNDGNACTQTDTCQNGVCTGVPKGLLIATLKVEP
jgi:hypothetical protein